ncbi:MAG: Chemoreceptor glutamine deamidase CheD [Syntrophorhabdus sp. PtaU1.Bin058]|nr:MAG: Chemoreceptor glutamine deamidase CheD [Syntrophorhabdus sp. PtaU1.Bin058]
MTPYDVSLLSVYLKPGELHVTDRPAIITTVLGSCISVIMFSDRPQLAGMCHAMLPFNGGTNGCDVVKFKYVDASIAYMVRKFEHQGVRRSDIKVKLFGGADILYYIEEDKERHTVGKKNITKALEIINNERLNLLMSDVGGTSGRKIFFFTHTGEILLKRLCRKTQRSFK